MRKARRDVGRALTGVVILVVFLCGVVVCAGRVESGVVDGRVYWWAPGATWWMKLLAECDAARVREMSRDAGVRSAGFKFYMMIVDEPGDWFTLSMRPVKVKSVVFTPRTKMVVFRKDGRVVESEGFFFWPDRVQSALYESRKGVVVVNTKSVYQGTTGFCPIGAVKFPAGSLKYGDVDSFKVIGAVEQRDDGDAR